MLFLIIRLAIAVLAFMAANQSERPLARVLGLGYLIANGVMILTAALSPGALLTAAVSTGGTFLNWVFALGFLGSAAYAFWTNR